MPISEIASLLTSIKTAKDLAESYTSFKSTLDKDDAVSKILKELIATQESVLSIQVDRQELIAAKIQLEKKKKEAEQWVEDERYYQLEEPVRGVFVYAVKPVDNNVQPRPWFCANCWQGKVKSILQAEYHHESAASYLCHHCQAKITMRFKPDTIATMPRVRSRWDGF